MTISDHLRIFQAQQEIILILLIGLHGNINTIFDQHSIKKLPTTNSTKKKHINSRINQEIMNSKYHNREVLSMNKKNQIRASMSSNSS